MCGIFGLVVHPRSGLDRAAVSALLDDLFRRSESRGREAAGLAVRYKAGLSVFKRPQAASDMIRSAGYRAMLDEAIADQHLVEPVAVIGHSRLVTNGFQAQPENNQPVIRGDIVVVHNGIVVNVDALWQGAGLAPHSEVDTEVIAALIAQACEQGRELAGGVRDFYARLVGTAAIGVLSAAHTRLVLASNYQTLYVVADRTRDVVLFASERYILEQVWRHPALAERAHDGILPVPRDAFISVDLVDLSVETCPLVADAGPAAPAPRAPAVLRIRDYAREEHPARAELRRCTRCILPQTMPFITFDAAGVCNFCRDHRPFEYEGVDKLEAVLAPYRRNDGRPDCMVGFSGGRDSSYGLHLLKAEFGMNPVAFTYDWGMVTDLARRNQARICGQLGIEHIIVSADIQQKRNFIRSNVLAWLKRPQLGMVPLFMAGDKQYFHYMNLAARRNDIKLLIFCENGKFERTHFKSGFAGINEGSRRAFNVTPAEKLKLVAYYLRNFLATPAYFNASMLDSAFAFFSSYLLRHEHYLFLFDYVRWQEAQVEDTLLGVYDWETAPDTRSTWRIGDGTAAFYNYIYFTIAGFTENDTFRSKQIREGLISRDEALRLVAVENRPRWASLQWYAQQVGFDLNEALRVINGAPKLYGGAR
ncbi:MAG: hypothetical protein AB7I01_05140 [Gammaproteobacteria bacterium]